MMSVMCKFIVLNLYKNNCLYKYIRKVYKPKPANYTNKIA